MGDIRFALRQFFREPLFSLIVVVTLGLGVGGATAVYSFVHGVLFKPLPYPESNRLVAVCETHPELQAGFCPGSPANWRDWRETNRSLDAQGLARSWVFGIQRDDRSVGVRGGIATPGLFQAFRAQPVLGGLFEDRHIRTGNERVVLLTHSLWQSWYSGRRDIVGQTIEVDGTVHEIIGVLPAEFQVPWLESVELWIPLWPDRLEMRGWRGFWSFGRLRDDVSLDQARAEFATIRDRLETAHPDTNTGWGLVVDSLHERRVRPVRPALLLLLGAVALVLLIACANVAHLFLMRGSARERELSVRVALGAGRGRLIRQHLLESLTYAIAGGVAGLLLATWVQDVFVSMAPSWFPRLAEVAIDMRVLLFAAVISGLASLLFGIVPALQGAGLNPSDVLRDGRSAGQPLRGRRARDLLVVLETALACLLLVGAGLVVRSFTNLLDWQPGFDRENLLVAQAFAPQARYPTAAQKTDLFGRVLEELKSLPGVVAAGAGSAVPLWGGDGEQELYVKGRPVPEPGERPTAAWFDTYPGYFGTLGVTLVRGRVFTEQDTAGGPRVCVINETMARRLWPDENPIGQQLHMVSHDTSLEVVGVVGDIRPFHPEESTGSQIYWPFSQFPRGAVQFVLRTSLPQTEMVRAVRHRIESIDPDMELSTLRTMDDLVDRQLVNPRFSTALFGIFACVAIVLAAVGIYGVMAFSTTQRRHEIGVRIALGASRGQILGLVVRRGLALALAGVALGLVGALAATRLLRSLLVQITPTDPVTFVAVSLLVVGVALLASYLPARKATHVDPTVALRHE